MNNIGACLTSKSDDWATPEKLYKLVREKGFYDPCPLFADFDGLERSWGKKNFVNPPYSEISKWVDKSILEALKGKEVVLLIPARTDTKWFKRLWQIGCHFYFISGRLKFGSSKFNAPFPCMLVFLNDLNGWSYTYLVDREDLSLFFEE